VTIRNHMIAASFAGVAAVTLAGTVWAQAAAPAAAPAAAQKYLGSNFITIDGFRYGGQIPTGSDKNMDALKLLVKVADALGQLRDNQYGGSTHLVLGDTTPSKRIVGEGTWNGEKVSLRMDWDYRIPGVRIETTKADKSVNIQVAAGNLAWDEKTPGVYGKAAATSVQERLVLAYLMPSGVVTAAREALPDVKLSKDGAKDVLTIPVPQLGTNLIATLSTDYRPVKTEVTLNGKKYTGAFDDFLGDRGDYEVKFPRQISLKIDGKPFADITLEYHHTNPYLIFPVPKEVAAK
jgi:hypothetical protein